MDEKENIIEAEVVNETPAETSEQVSPYISKRVGDGNIPSKMSPAEKNPRSKHYNKAVGKRREMRKNAKHVHQQERRRARA